MNTIDKFHNWRRKLRWNKQYRNGRWDNLKGDKERIRYETIISQIQKYGQASPDILDLGCGEGVLLSHVIKYPYRSFSGMDFSSVSIEKAKENSQKSAEFICADIHSFTPTKSYDVIIFNEVFYYIHETERLNVIKRMRNYLKPNGIFIISIYREGHGCWNYFENETFHRLTFETITTDDDLTYWKVGTYRPASFNL